MSSKLSPMKNTKQQSFISEEKTSRKANKKAQKLAIKQQRALQQQFDLVEVA